jgi:L-2-hydroxyglutarate oxidase LhgO
MGLGSYDIAVVGGGIIGLATAMALRRQNPGLSLVVVEKESRVGLHQTGHNSGVMHAGLYYTPGSQKANFCATGARMLRRFCDERGIDYRMCGKVVVALDESQLPGLEDLFRRGTANGAEGLKMVGRERLRELEPHAAGIKAIHSPNTGVVDYNQVTDAFADEVRGSNGELFTDARLTGVVESDGRLVLETTRGDLSASSLINCAGLQADSVARTMGVDTGVRIIPFRGEYFSLRPERTGLVRGLIYPVPDPKLPFLGVHFTRRVDGSVEAGPNAVLALAREGYSKTAVEVRHLQELAHFPGFWRMSAMNWKTGVRETYRSLVKRRFVKSLQALVPDVRSQDLWEPGAGVRAQAVGRDGRLLQDFSIVSTRNAMHVLNAPSPGATSSMAIGEHIAGMAAESFSLSGPIATGGGPL